MLPNYQSFKSDLEMLRGSILSLRTELEGSVKPNKLGEKTMEIYDELIRKFNSLQDNLRVLIDEPDNNVNLNWSTLKGMLTDFELYRLPPVKNGDADKVRELTELFNHDDNARVLWSISRKLGSLAPFTDEMEAMDSIELYQHNIGEYQKARDAYENAVASFDEPIRYNSYEEMLIERRELTQRLSDYRTEYEAYLQGDYVARINREYESFKAVKTYEKTQLINERGEYVIRANDIGKTGGLIDQLDEKLQRNAGYLAEENAAAEKQNARIDENMAQIAGLKAEIDKINAQLSDVLNERAQKQARVEVDERTLERYRTQVPGRLDDAGMRVVIAQRQKFIAVHDELDALVRLKADVDAKVTELGFNQLTPDELRSCIRDGRIFERYADKLIAKDALNRIALYRAMKEFIERYKAIYHPSKAMAESIDQNVIDPYDLNHLIDKSVNSLQTEITRLLNPDANDPELKGADVEIVKYNLQGIERAYEEISELHNTETVNDEAETLLLERARDYNAKIAELEASNEEIADNIDRYYANKAKELEAEKAELLREKADNEAKAAEYDERVNAVDKECREQYSAVYELNEKFNLAKNRFESAEKKYTKLCADIESYEKVCALRRDFLEKGKAVKNTLEINDRGEIVRDVFAGCRRAMEDEIQKFYNVKDCGRKLRHNDSVEYKSMIGAVEDLLGIGEHFRTNTLSAEALQEKLRAVNTASTEYIRLKKREFRPFGASTQRKARLDFAAQLRDYALDCANRIDNHKTVLNGLNAQANGRQLNHAIASTENSVLTVLQTINFAAEKKAKLNKEAERGVNAPEKGIEKGQEKAPSAKL